MTTESNHTPTLIENGKAIQMGFFVLRHHWEGVGTSQDILDNNARIVKACNQHDALVKIAEAALLMALNVGCRYYITNAPDCDCCGCLLKRTLAAYQSLTEAGE